MCNCHQKYELLPEFEMLEYDVESQGISVGTRKSKEYIRWIQISLNHILRLKVPLPVNGVITSRTKSVIELFQRKSGIGPSGSVDDATEAAMVKAGASSAPLHKASLSLNCTGEVDITQKFKDFIRDAQIKVTKITKPPLTQKIIREILDIVGPEGGVNIQKFKVLSCSKIINPLVIGETIGAEVHPDQKILNLSNETWELTSEFLSTGDLSVLVKFFQIIAHEKRHSTLGSKVVVKPSGLKRSANPQAADLAAYRVHEILVKAEEIAVAKTINPGYTVPADVQGVFRKNWNIVVLLVTDKESIRLRNLIKQELSKRYLSAKGCDSSMTLGVLRSMDTGQWFRCFNGSVNGSIPDGLKICKNADGTHQVCGIH